MMKSLQVQYKWNIQMKNIFISAPTDYLKKNCGKCRVEYGVGDLGEM